MIEILKKLLSREFLTTMIVIVAIIIISIQNNWSAEVTAAALTGSGAVYVWGRTRQKQNGG